MNLPLNCSASRARFGEHLRGQLPPSEALALEQHLRRCPSCREVLALERRLAAGDRDRVAAPADLAAAILAQSRPRPARPIRIGAILRNAAVEAAFRAFVDPLLWLDLHLRDACAPLWQLATGLLAGTQLQLRAEGLKLCQYLAFPLRHAGRQLSAALASPADPNNPRR